MQSRFGQWINAIKARWPGSNGRRLIFARVMQVESRLVELQVQLTRRLDAIDRHLPSAEDRTATVSSLADIRRELAEVNELVRGGEEELKARLSVLRSESSDGRMAFSERLDAAHVDLSKVTKALHTAFVDNSEATRSEIARRTKTLTEQGRQLGDTLDKLRVITVEGTASHQVLVEGVKTTLATSLGRVVAKLDEAKTDAASIKVQINAANGGIEKRLITVDESLASARKYFATEVRNLNGRVEAVPEALRTEVAALTAVLSNEHAVSAAARREAAQQLVELSKRIFFNLQQLSKYLEDGKVENLTRHAAMVALLEPLHSTAQFDKLHSTLSDAGLVMTKLQSELDRIQVELSGDHGLKALTAAHRNAAMRAEAGVGNLLEAFAVITGDFQSRRLEDMEWRASARASLETLESDLSGDEGMRAALQALRQIQDEHAAEVMEEIRLVAGGSTIVREDLTSFRHQAAAWQAADGFELEEIKKSLATAFEILKSSLDGHAEVITGLPALLENVAKARHADIMNNLLSTEQFGKSMAMATDHLIARQNANPQIEHLLTGLARLDGTVQPLISELRSGVAALDRQVRADSERIRDFDVMRVRDTGPADWARTYDLFTEHPVALASDDHRFPRGTSNDNTRSPRFVAACRKVFGQTLTHLDLGCAGGGLVRDFLIDGHRSMGLEGSDWSLLEQRAEWRALGLRLRTCDITKPFKITDQGREARFDVISAWEVLEHLPAESLPQFFSNVAKHLSSGGLFVASIATFEDRDPETGAVWHVTIEGRDWWVDQLNRAGLSVVDTPFAPRDYVRGSGSSIDDWDAVRQPHMGFHLVAKTSQD